MLVRLPDRFSSQDLHAALLAVTKIDYPLERLDDPDWCIKEASRWGLSTSVTCVAEPGDDPAQSVGFVPELSDTVIQPGGTRMFGTLREAAGNLILTAALWQFNRPTGIREPRQPHPDAPPPGGLPIIDGYESEIRRVSKGRYAATDAQAADCEWVMRELLRLGYSVRASFTTPDDFIATRRSNGLMRENAQVQAMLEQIRVLDGFYTYQLLGHQYTSRGAHESPTTPTLQYCLVGALFAVAQVHPCLERYRLQ